MVQLVALTDALAYPREYIRAMVLLNNMLNEFEDEDALSKPSASQDPGLAAFSHRKKQVNDLDARFEEFLFSRVLGL